MVTVLMIVVAFVVVSALVGLLAYAGAKIERVQAEVREAQDAHDRCHEATEAVLVQSVARTQAAALRAAAVAWESIEEKPNLFRLAREKYIAGGPSMPVIWLNDRADRLDPFDESDTDLYSLPRNLTERAL